MYWLFSHCYLSKKCVINTYDSLTYDTNYSKYTIR